MVFDLLITFFLFAITVVMLAGAGSLLQQWLDLPEVWGSVLATIATVLIVCWTCVRSSPSSAPSRRCWCS